MASSFLKFTVRIMNKYRFYYFEIKDLTMNVQQIVEKKSTRSELLLKEIEELIIDGKRCQASVLTRQC